ncbi:MAG: glycosyl transferase 2 family protein [Zetaproteobacteria bacterium]|nr:MAG: glycosyl transferase 2 family protein [Zetaproteobacteria bacterium]
MGDIPISVLITTKNEESNIARCLDALKYFSQVIVIDSHSSDNTCDISRRFGVETILYKWNGQYPKKRQWCLETLNIQHDWVFFVDADEVVTPACVEEIRTLFQEPRAEAGFFVKGEYVLDGTVLRHGLKNNKLALIHRERLEFPVVDDLSIDGMGEIEGHYQPVLKSEYARADIGQICAPLLHYAYEDDKEWLERHERYAAWESEMTKRGIWPKDPILWRQMVKTWLRKSIFRSYAMFLYSYIVKLGFLDGKMGYRLALSRQRYCALIYRKLN